MGQTKQDESISAHRLALACELLDDLELSRLGPEALLLKATRLARLMDAPDIKEWLDFELRGYQNAAGAAYERWVEATGRLTDRAKQIGYLHSLAGINAWIQAMEAELRSLRVPDLQFSIPPITGEFLAGLSTQANINAATAPIGNVMQRMATLTQGIAHLKGIASRVIGLLHDFVSKSYYELAFRGLAESIFEAHRKEIDALLAKAAGDSLQKIPAIAQRLAEGDPEAISQALTTGRRVLATFADSIQPPQDEPLNLGGTPHEATGEKYLNRLKYFIAMHCTSEKRKQRLQDTVSHLNTRFAAGVHADFTAEEARALFVILYVTLGEILSLKPA